MYLNKSNNKKINNISLMKRLILYLFIWLAANGILEVESTVPIDTTSITLDADDNTDYNTLSTSERVDYLVVNYIYSFSNKSLILAIAMWNETFRWLIVALRGAEGSYSNLLP